jgi:hypothetical protein
MNLIDLLGDVIGYGVVSEAGLSRVLSRVEGNDFAIVSAYRSGNSNRENKKLHGQLLSQLNSKRMGGYVLIGHWQEAPDGVDYQDATPDQLTDSVEESVLFVKPDDLDTDEFITMAIDLGKQYGQDAVLVGLNEGDEVPKMGVYLYYKNGARDKIGSKLSLNKMGQAYSQLKSKPEVPFIFEGTLSPSGKISKELFKAKNIIH